jgi:sugar O-acyltransferase (sialic acid O-acetyltransferase NeuD family)
MADIIFLGTSNMLSDLFDCAMALGHRVRAVVRLQPEVMRPRTRSVASRLDAITPRPDLIDISEFRPLTGEIYAFGTQNSSRRAWVGDLKARFGIAFSSLIHPLAEMSPQARVGEAVYLNPGAMVGPGAVLGDHVCLYRGATIGHDCRIGAYSRVSVGSNIAGHVTIGEDCTISMGCTVAHELVIGDGALVGAGSVVIRDVPAGATVAGVPARIIRTAAP